MGVNVDVGGCLQQGLIGAFGSVPGTLCAHPLDVLKIRLQTTTGISQWQAARLIFEKDGARGFYRGLLPGLEQRFIARGPMFLVSELCTQSLEHHTPLNNLEARGLGSCVSGYSVGFMQALPEYRKKLLSQGVLRPSEARWSRLWRTASSCGLLRTGLFRRFHAAATCSAVFDATFFVTRDLMSKYAIAPPLAYGCAAILAVAVAYPSDTATARMLVKPPSEPIMKFRHYLSLDSRAFRGFSARGGEFFISFAVTGMVASLLQTSP
eukprot:TRINITY_DN99422_c0_g1_i1.p1 TRINITY_DN99422_c0_g1~~TRINITY_DN99422_c0_g1_i1.p1  ORF type:complete len:266 (+),score=48.42 TRINITY_DN99422_c0_g1_i1:48-845(+)